ncbi:thiol reductant ABC exporter subunit CydD [Hoyosella rhizosphaerae]|uniref:Thiol reductant ABC exporter subunit CydD n=1 Tax=Hoyosella rhizosphaerae TaxID=1755582 RepID=A0A916UI35_9ACTN|nr:thiol reductant ABC exporter subunit CydD [Hoyosella rhizosphaerae]MBN4928248.1 thiol reductant ABC exporter subunit CydD [Hoyosella rhizosphaerae]GGC73536.1 thiol reductant ABC exporter subunit CydD [Hoyosella rhizosphaerae]
MKPFDPRLWHLSRPVRPYLVLTVVMGVVTAAAVVVMAVMIATIVAGVATEPAMRTPQAWTAEIIVLAAAVAVRVGASWLHTRYAHRSAYAVIAGLKQDVTASVAAMSPRRRAAVRDDAAAIVTRGLDGLGPYLTGFLPTLALAAVVTPTVLIVITLYDLTSGLIIFFTLPLIPIFMVLIGLLTQGRARAKLRTMSQLSAQVLDLIAGLPTLRTLGREAGQAESVHRLGDSHRKTTMESLRIAFLSSLVLEMLATLCVALVAVSVGLRLVYGHMELAPGLVALILAAEAYLPLRMIGTQFHAAEDGVEAADKAISLITDPADETTATAIVGSGPQTIRLTDMSLEARGGHAPHQLSAEFAPGTFTVMTGPNGVGKTSALHAILGLVSPSEGTVTIDGTDIADVDHEAWWRTVAWVPQKPVLLPGTIKFNLELAGPLDNIDSAARKTGFDEVIKDAKHGLNTILGSGGAGLSLGQRQRLALTRALARDAAVIILDEPTAHLDHTSATQVLDELKRRAHAGATVIVVAHHPHIVAAADNVVEVRA